MGLIFSTHPTGLYLMNSNKNGIVEHVQTTVSRLQTKKGPEKFHLRFLLHFQSYKGWIHFQSTSRTVAFASSNFFY